MLILEPNEPPIILVSIEIYLFEFNWYKQAEHIFLTFQTPLLAPDPVDSPMDALQHLCHTCNYLKPLSGFNLCANDEQYGKKGDPTSKCMRCTLQNQQSCQKWKWKCNNDDPEEPLTIDSVLPFDQFPALLANLASDGSLHCRIHVNTEGMVGDAKEVADIVAGHVWEATGYRFTLVDLEYNVTRINCWQTLL